VEVRSRFSRYGTARTSTPTLAFPENPEENHKRQHVECIALALGTNIAAANKLTINK
jgi:hypothetical protein